MHEDYLPRTTCVSEHMEQGSRRKGRPRLIVSIKWDTNKAGVEGGHSLEIYAQRDRRWIQFRKVMHKVTEDGYSLERLCTR